MKKPTPLILTAWVLHAATWFLAAIEAHDETALLARDSEW